MALNGYDISNNQGNIDNRLVPGNFVFIKATEGVGYTDPNCDANYQQAKAAGKLLGVYHFARPDGNDPISEARWFYSQVKGYLGEAVIALDLEVKPITPGWAKSFADEFYRLSKVRVVIYMSQSVFNTGDWSALTPNYAAWVASYGANNQQTGYGDPNAPVSINGNWTIFGVQYTSRGRLPGWGGDLDLDIAYVTPDQWKRYAAGDRNTPAPTPPPVHPAPVPAPVPTPPAVVVTPPVVVPEPVKTPIPVTHEPTPVHDIPVAITPLPATVPSTSLLGQLITWINRFFEMMRR